MPPSTAPRNLILSLSILTLFSFPIALRSQEPIRVTVCDLIQKPTDFNHKLIQVSGLVAHGFEEFTLFDLDCPGFPGIWLDYGGKRRSGTTFCCGEPANGTRRTPLKVEGLEIPLTIDKKFETFDKLTHAERATVIQATLIGRFFSGHATGKAEWGGGFGHLGCCVLLAIQQVVSASPRGESNLDLSEDAFQIDPPARGCSIRDISKDLHEPDSVKVQQSADIQQDQIRFDQPLEIAKSALAQAENLDKTTVANLRETRQADGRATYELKIQNKNDAYTIYTIVLHKPYALTFLAINPHRIAWVVMALYKTTCTKPTP